MKGILVQAFSSIIISLGNFLMGFSIAWPSFALQVLESDRSPTGGPISSFEANLVGSLIMLGTFVVTPCTGLLSDRLGKKKMLVLGALAFTLSWSLISTEKSIVQLLIGRLVLGMANGIQLVTSLPFIGEFSQDSIRGIMFSILILSYCFGMLVAYVTGWLCSYDVVNYLNLTISVLFVIALWFLRETPAFLVEKKRDKEALRSLQFYRGVSNPTKNVLEEMSSLCQQRNSGASEKPDPTEKEMLAKEEGENNGRNEMSPWQLLCSSKPAQRALFIVSLHIVLLILGGTIAVSTYASQLFKKASPNLSNDICAVILAVAFAGGSVLSLIACDLVGRRTLMLISTSSASLLLILLASLLRWTWAPEWMVPAVVLAYCCLFQMGAASVPFIQSSECFVHKLKNLASTIVNSAGCLANFVVLAAFPPVVDHLGLDGVFLVFAFICILLTISSFFLMRETKGIPIEEIQIMFEDGLLYRKKK